MKSAGTNKKPITPGRQDEAMAALKAALKNGRRAIKRAQRTADKIDRQLGERTK